MNPEQFKQLVNNIRLSEKILGSGDLNKKFDIDVNFITGSAKAKIEKLGGKVTLIK